MAIDGLGSISTEQLLAMSMMGNGQLTNDSVSSSSSSGQTDEVNYAFQLMMQNYIDKAKESEKNNVEAVINNAANASEKTEAVSEDNKAESSDDGLSELASATANAQTAKQIQQRYLTGQNLLDIPLVINGSNVSYSSSGYTPSNASKAELEKIYSAVKKASKEYGVDENLIYAIIKQESDFDSTCTSGVGAAGLMQIMPANFSHLGISDAYDVDQNVDGGTKLLKEYLNQYGGDVQMALMAYNGGPGTMQRRGVSSSGDLYKMPSETQNYVPKVMGYYQSQVRS
ncbi:MAG: lytic transglycosylase domain-containing protein [Clostridium sp.]|nr:lytic transglycosylase domain-containing protein [Clostridium sp.]